MTGPYLETSFQTLCFEFVFENGIKLVSVMQWHIDHHLMGTMAASLQRALMSLPL